MIDKPLIALINRSTVVSNDAIGDYLPILQTAVSRDLCPAWNIGGVDLEFVLDKTMQIQPKAYVLAVLDNTSQANDLGFHDVTADGNPIGYCFAKTDIDYGEDWRITLSHELFEMIIDPFCNSIVTGKMNGKEVMTLREACDAVESDSCAYIIDGVPVSDFLFPIFFDTFSAHPFNTRFDFNNKISAPLTIAPGGYMSVMEPNSGEGWKMVFGQQVPFHKKLPPQRSRRERFLLRANHGRQLQPSTAI